MAALEKPAKVRILELLKVNPSKKFTYGQISDELKLSKTNIGKLINPMAKAGKLLVKKIGNQKIVKSMASSSSDQRSSSIHSSSSENSEFIVQEKSDIATAVLNWIQGYRINVVRNPNGKQAILEMPRMLSLYKKLSEVEYKETKNDDFKEYLSKIKDNKDINHEDD